MVCREFLIAVLLFSAALGAEETPIALHPDNPHYFLFRGKPTILITSGEHYGSVLNLDFNYLPYLDELKARGFNLTRAFAGTYREIPGSFGIRDNTLAPAPNRYLAPWARSDQPGYFDGGNKFDLGKWDEAYFKRLKDFVSQASQRGIVVNFGLFCPNYDEKLWHANPMYSGNNINGIGDFPHTEPYTLKHKDLLEIQVALVKKIVAELKEFDNVYFEICNEPYFGGVTLEWQKQIANTIVEAEKDFPHKHLIAQNIANNKAKINEPNPDVSIFHFHYAYPPETVAMNWAINKPICFDESGFRGSEPEPYRTEAWAFIMAGGALYDNLDYSFNFKTPDGTSPISAPGGGGPVLRAQYKLLKDFIHSFDFIHMSPKTDFIKSALPKDVSAYVLANPGKAYATFIHTSVKNKPKDAATLTLAVDLPAGKYNVEWFNTLSGNTDKQEEIESSGSTKEIQSPPYNGEYALKIIAK